MKTKNPLILTVLSVIASFGFVQAQTKASCNTVTAVAIVPQTNDEDLKAYYQDYQTSIGSEFDGTYQFLISGNEKISVTSETFSFIQLNRNKKEEVLVKLSDHVSVRILPEKKIQSKKFTPVTEMFIVESK
jgi:hypothetical protein